jgi:hypothetical protein
MANKEITTVRLEANWADIVRDLLLQGVGIAAAIVFGTWTVLAWQEQKQSNTQSTQANTFAFAAFCAQIWGGYDVGLALFYRLCSSHSSL